MSKLFQNIEKGKFGSTKNSFKLEPLNFHNFGVLSGDTAFTPNSNSYNPIDTPVMKNKFLAETNHFQRRHNSTGYHMFIQPDSARESSHSNLPPI